MSVKWGITRAKHNTGLPVMVTETGYTSTESLFPGMNEEVQAKLTKRVLWESLVSGAMGVSLFHFNDRSWWDISDREKGFGIVTLDKKPKLAYYAVNETYILMGKLKINYLFSNSENQKPDLVFLWEDATDTIYNRYVAEMKGLFGALERLGFEPNFINKEELLNGGYKNFKAIILPRNQKMSDETFGMLQKIIQSKVKLHANADLPGLMNEYGVPRQRQSWLSLIKEIFGIDATRSTIDYNLEDSIDQDGFEISSIRIWDKYKPKFLYFIDKSFAKEVYLWKYRDKILSDGGDVLMTFDNETGNPAIVINKKDKKSEYYDAAVSLFSLGDGKFSWIEKSNLVGKIYLDAFGLKPMILSSNKLVLVNYKVLSNNDVLILAMNFNGEEKEFTEITSSLLAGKKVVNLLYDEEDFDYIVNMKSEGTIKLSLEPNGFALLLAIK